MPDTIARSALFVPGSRPERFAKALGSGAERVIVDLEDAVEASAKDAARANLAAYACKASAGPVWVRINDATTRWFDADLRACAQHPAIAGIMLPKAERVEDIETAARTGRPVVALVETVRGACELPAISRAPGVVRLAFGTIDFSLDAGLRLGTPGAAAMLDHVRCQMTLHSRMAGIAPAWDGVHAGIDDTAGLEAAARHARELGFGGMLCIHPAQVAVIHSTFAPSASEFEWARRVLEQSAAHGGAAFQLDGKMIDRPIIESALKILESVSSKV